jgi:two-component system chemotaxis response regulator CheB
MSAVRVAIVDDALFIREGLRRLLGDERAIEVVGAAASGEELLAQLEAWAPDVITLDLHMPGMGGLATLDRLMARRPVPVIILSTHSGAGAPLTVEALGRGAADFIDKEAYSLVDFEALRAVLVEKILHVTGQPPDATPNRTPMAARTEWVRGPGTVGRFQLVVIGASTGGPRAVEQLLLELGADVPVPIVVAQHMPPGFTAAFAERLNRNLPLRVVEGAEASRLAAGVAYIAPAGRHTRLLRGPDGPTLTLVDHVPGAANFPSVDELFGSAAAVGGAACVAVLLTGMGRDGALGMAQLWRAGAHTIAQDEGSCVVYGMPRAAVEAGAAREVLPLHAIGSRVRDLLLTLEPLRELERCHVRS